MNVNSITNGVVIDHISAGKAMRLYEMLKLDLLDCSVAVIKNVPSKKMGKKDIIKIDSDRFDFNLDVVGFISPNATINIIKDGKLIEKNHVELPKQLINIIRCKNPRCITTTEQGIKHIFTLSDAQKKEYRCIYCDTEVDF